MRNYDQAISDISTRMHHESIEAKERQALSDSMSLAKKALEQMRDREGMEKSGKSLLENYKDSRFEKIPVTQLAVAITKLYFLLSEIQDAYIAISDSVGTDEGILETLQKLRKGT